MKSIVLAILIVLITAGGASAIQMKCNECHSKKPPIKRMHAALGYKDCFSCHNPLNSMTPQQRAMQKQTDPK